MPCPETPPPRPIVPERLQFYWRAFWAVAGDRSMETGRISFLALDRYAERYGVVSQDEFDRFLTIVTSMDGEYVSRSSTDGNSVDFNDVEGVKALFANIARRADGNDEEPE